MQDFQVNFRFSGDNVFTLQYNLIGIQVEKQRRVVNMHVSMQESVVVDITSIEMDFPIIHPTPPPPYAYSQNDPSPYPSS
jgi:hypothetical protein